ncbi:hypothetical protein Mapa_005062 [Marchantia paleacea]|nr:hypothetical protein Mapa_005062 [Marchantia paleacea]
MMDSELQIAKIRFSYLRVVPSCTIYGVAVYSVEPCVVTEISSVRKPAKRLLRFRKVSTWLVTMDRQSDMLLYGGRR